MENPGLLEGVILDIFKFMADTLNAVPNTATDGLTAAANAVDWMVGLVSASSILIPTTDIFIIIGLIMAQRTAAFALFVANWIIRRVVDAIP